MFLSQEQLAELTGFTRPSAQAKWLTQHGWRYVARADGRLVVHELEAQKHLCSSERPRAARRTEANLKALQ